MQEFTIHAEFVHIIFLSCVYSSSLGLCFSFGYLSRLVTLLIQESGLESELSAFFGCCNKKSTQ